MVLLAGAPRGEAPLRLVEIVGPAGCGKSALTGAFYDAVGYRGYPLSLWGQPRKRLLASAVRLLPLALAGAVTGRWFRPYELTQMARVDTLRRLVDDDARAVPRASDGTALIEEGPVFALAWCEAFHPNAHAFRAKWRTRAIAEWATRIQCVVRLDADDSVLVHRIRSRPKDHLVKDMPDEGINEFSRRFRVAFDRVLGEMTAISDIRVVTMRSDHSASTELARRLKSELDESRFARRLRRPHLQVVRASGRTARRLKI